MNPHPRAVAPKRIVVPKRTGGRRRGRRRWINGINLAALVIAVIVAAPLYWMITSSLKGPKEIGGPPSVWPHQLSGANYQSAFSYYHFETYLLNSLIVSVCATIIVLGLGMFAGYALARLPMRGTFTIMVALLMISLFPAIAVVSPLYLIMRDLGWLNSYQALIIPYAAFNLPFAIWILRNFFLSIPREMEEVARVDGASPSRTVLSIIVPQVLPGLFTAGVFTFTACWTEFLMALTFNNSDHYRTIAVGIAEFGSEFTVPYGTIFAAATVAVVPIGILVLVFRRSVVSGLTSGAVKG
jgi:multiple sugar transport system permease protein